MATLAVHDMPSMHPHDQIPVNPPPAYTQHLLVPTDDKHIANVTRDLTDEQRKQLYRAGSDAGSSLHVDDALVPAAGNGQVAPRSGELAATTDAYVPSFHPTKTLVVQSQGMQLMRLPIPSRELEIAVLHQDGTIAYLSRRAHLSSGNAVLSSGDGRDLVASYYKFGPGNPPWLQRLNNNNSLQPFIDPSGKGASGRITTKDEWTSHTINFQSTDGAMGFRWSYRSDKLFKGDKHAKADEGISDGSSNSGPQSNVSQHAAKKRKVLALEIVPDTNDKHAKPVRIAQLVRNDDTRTAGSTKSSAGNGGYVYIDEAVMREARLDESVVVATCVLMLKREMDRRRSLQMAVCAGAALAFQRRFRRRRW